MVDEGQDLDAYAYQILRGAVPHVSVFADARQQIFEGGLGEAELLPALGVAQQTASLLPSYRNSPDVAKLASYFGNHFDGLNYTAKDRQKPCFYVAADWDDEIDQMAAIIREQMRLNHKVCIIVPTNRDLYGVATRLGERGVPVEKATPPRRGAPAADFNTLTPKIATYHSAKGLTFDCVILPKLVENNFQRVQGPRRHRLLLVGITRAMQWVYLSTVRGYEFKEVALLREAEAKGDLFVLTSAKSASAPPPPPAEEPVPEESFFGPAPPGRPAVCPPRPVSNRGQGDLHPKATHQSPQILSRFARVSGGSAPASKIIHASSTNPRFPRTPCLPVRATSG